jgi:hypothetical protein
MMVSGEIFLLNLDHEDVAFARDLSAGPSRGRCELGNRHDASLVAHVRYRQRALAA